MNPSDTTRVLILGGGFAGVYTAMYLERALRKTEHQRVNIALVNAENYLVFQPMLPEVISGSIETLHVICPIRRLAPRTRLYSRAIEEIDLEKRLVRLSPGFLPRPLELEYDHLVIALGTALDHARVPGMREHALQFKYLGDALALRNHLVRVLEEADIEANPDERRKLLTFVVAGGGFSGVECVAELNDFVRTAARVYRRLRADEIKVVLLQSGARILPEISEGLARFAHRILERRGVQVRLQSRLEGVTADAAYVNDSQSGTSQAIATRTTVVTVPARPHSLVSHLSFELVRGRISVDPFLAVKDHPGVWALGDCAAVPQPDGIMSPPTAQHAVRQARTCANNIVAAIRGRAASPFSFTGLGKLGSLGRRSAVAEVFGLKLSGFVAWLLWRGVYLAKFPGFERKMRILSDWLLDIFLPSDITQVRIFRRDAVAQEHFETGEVVFDQGDFGDKVYVVVRGEAQAVDQGQVIGTMRSGDIFGEIALIADSPRSARVEALTPLDVVAVSRATFVTLLAHFPGVQEAMEHVMGQRLGQVVELRGPDIAMRS